MLGDDNTAARRLRLIRAEFTQHAQHGPDPTGRTVTRTEAPAPLDLGVIDYMEAVAAEVDEHMRAVEPPAGQETRPRPADPAERYEWWRDNTAHLDAHRQAAREAVIYRQGLEHAIRMGDTSAIRPHPCPECGCYGLLWNGEARNAQCVNHYCVDRHGISYAWTLQQLAQHHIASKSAVRSRAT